MILTQCKVLLMMAQKLELFMKELLQLLNHYILNLELDIFSLEEKYKTLKDANS